MRHITIPRAPLCALWLLERAGYPAYIVGGSLRDALMGHTPHDWDVTTAARPDQMLELFDASTFKTIPTGLKHGTLTLLVDGEPIECTTYRVDGAYTDARHPDSVSFTDRVADDLARRDFTVNAMACRLPDLAARERLPDTDRTLALDALEIIDLYGGREDILAGVIRCVGDPGTRFTEDALRMLRAVRFAVQLDFEIDGATEAALAQKADTITHISVERVASELCRMLAGEHPSRGLEIMSKTRLLEHVLPLPKNPYFIDETALFEAVDTLPPVAMLRLALLLCGAGADGARVTCRALKLSTKQTEAVATYIASLGEPIPKTDADLRRRMARYGEHTDGGLLLAQASGLLPEADGLISRCTRIRARGDCLSLGSLAVDGRDLMQTCGLRGGALGRTLTALLDTVLENPEDNERERLLLIAKQIKKET